MQQLIFPHQETPVLALQRATRGVALDLAGSAPASPGGKIDGRRARWCPPLPVPHFLVCEDLGRFVRPASDLAIARLNFLYS
jgi:hypothetical protein